MGNFKYRTLGLKILLNDMKHERWSFVLWNDYLKPLFGRRKKEGTETFSSQQNYFRHIKVIQIY